MVTETAESPSTPVDMLTAAVDGMATEQLWQLGDDQLLCRMDDLGTVIDRLQGIRLRTIVEAEQRQACRDDNWTATDRLADTDRKPLRQARAMVKQAGRLDRFGIVGQALCAGSVTSQQAAAIGQALDELPDTLSEDTLAQAQQEMIDHAARFDPAALRRLGNHLVEVLCPGAVEDRLGEQLSREEARARRDRFLDWRHTGDGSVILRGRLPVLEGDTITTVIESYTRRGDSSIDADLDPQAEVPTAGRRRADAFVALIHHVQARRLAPTISGDRPRAVITMSYEALVSGIRGATLIGSAEPIAPGTARRVACSGELVPAVLGGPSVVLDVARPVRLFTGLLRQALTIRDGGCVFPDCDTPPEACEGHHVQPWWAGGQTKLDNGVLLCRHHHDLVEPDPKAPTGSRWRVRLDDHGLPEVIPPAHLDPRQMHRQHVRFAERRYHRRP